MTIAAHLRRFEPIIRHVRPIYRRARTRYLQWRYPGGGYVTGTGLPVFADFTSETYAWYDADEPKLAFDRRIIATLVGQSIGSVFIDVGAHFGYYSGLFADLTKERAQPVKIIAIEPDRRNFACLERTVALYAHVTPILLSAAAGDVDGHVAHFRSAAAPCLHSFDEESAEEMYTVPAMRLDTIVREHLGPGEKIAVVKVDIDGAEAAFLRGAAATLAAHRPITFIEFSPVNLRGSGSDPRVFFEDLCSGWVVYCVSSAAGTVRRVGMADYSRIEGEVGGGVTDLIASPAPLELESVNR